MRGSGVVTVTRTVDVDVDVDVEDIVSEMTTEQILDGLSEAETWDLLMGAMRRLGNTDDRSPMGRDDEIVEGMLEMCRHMNDISLSRRMEDSIRDVSAGAR